MSNSVYCTWQRTRSECSYLVKTAEVTVQNELSELLVAPVWLDLITYRLATWQLLLTVQYFRILFCSATTVQFGLASKFVLSDQQIRVIRFARVEMPPVSPPLTALPRACSRVAALPQSPVGGPRILVSGYVDTLRRI